MQDPKGRKHTRRVGRALILDFDPSRPKVAKPAPKAENPFDLKTLSQLYAIADHDPQLFAVLACQIDDLYQDLVRQSKGGA